MRTLNRRRRMTRRRRGAIIVEFALVVPFISLIVFGVIDFSRAYTQLNALDSALREGARYGGKLRDFTGSYDTIVKQHIQDYADQFGFTGLDMSKISVAWDKTVPMPEYITVTATAHPIPLQILGRF